MKSLGNLPYFGLVCALTILGVAAFGVFGVEWDEKVGAGEYIVGAGTLALAVGTVWLARQTARQADLTKQSVEDAERPYLIAWSGPAGWMTLLPFAQSTSAPPEPVKSDETLGRRI